MVEKLDNGSYCYCICYCLNETRTDRKDVSHLSIYPEQLVPYEPVDRPGNCSGQINVSIGKLPFIEAIIKGFGPTKPFRVPANYSHVKKEFPLNFRLGFRRGTKTISMDGRRT